MNRAALQVFIGFVLLVGLTAGLLLRVRSNYVLGNPGVKVVDVPMYNEEGKLVTTNSVYLPLEVGEFISTNLPVYKIEQGMLPPDTVYGRRLYRARDGFSVSASVVLMGTDRTSIHKPQYCLIGQGETIIANEMITIPIGQPHPYELKVMKLDTTAQRAAGGGKFVTVNGIFLYWFVADGQLTPYHGERMWLMGRDLVTKGLLQRWAYIAYYGQCFPGQEKALLERMKQFVAASVPEFQITTGRTAAAAAQARGGAKPIDLAALQEAH
jgi:hypothetical protein